MAQENPKDEFLELYGQLPEETQRLLFRLVEKMARVHQGRATLEEIRAVQALREKYARGETLTLEDLYQSVSDIPAQ